MWSQCLQKKWKILCTASGETGFWNKKSWCVKFPALRMAKCFTFALLPQKWIKIALLRVGKWAKIHVTSRNQPKSASPLRLNILQEGAFVSKNLTFFPTRGVFTVLAWHCQKNIAGRPFGILKIELSELFVSPEKNCLIMLRTSEWGDPLVF